MAAGAAGSPVEEAVNAAIEDFEQPWSPPTRRLRGWVVGINPPGAGSAQVSERLCADLSLLTAVHLYHLVLAGGGSPVLTRADDTRAADSGRSVLERRVDVVRQRRCDLCVSIRYAEAAVGAAVRREAAEQRPKDTRLAEALAAELAVKPAVAGQPTPGRVGFIEMLCAADKSADMAACEVCFGCPPEVSSVGIELRKACLENARRLYTGISRFCNEHGSRRDSPATRSPVPDYPSSEAAEQVSRLERSIWPLGDLPSERIDWFCRRFAQVSITNRSLVYFEVSAHLEQTVAVLRGRANVPKVTNGLEQALRDLGVEHVRNEVEALPDRERLGEHLFGVCRVPMALTYNQPGTDGGVQTQLMFGEPLFLLDRVGEFYLLHAGDGYWGWVRHDAVQPMTAEQFDAYRRHPQGAVCADIAGPQGMIPRGTSVPVMRTTGDVRMVLLPDGSTLTVPVTALTIDEHESAGAASRVQAALDLLYTPYLFGGCSPLGLDCSGLVANVWARTGRRPARDAWQQALAGRLVATAWHREGIQPGDQLFFINEAGKVYHTGVALDGVHVLHAAPPCVQIGSLDPRDRLYDRRLDRDFFLAKRP
jgi:hypothetical protein